MLEFSLPSGDITLSTIFSNLQEAKSLLQLQDFSVSQITLDQVFVGFANEQVNDFQRDHPVVTEPQQSAGQGYTNMGFVGSPTPGTKPPLPKSEPPKSTQKREPVMLPVVVGPIARMPPPMPLLRGGDHKIKSVGIARAKSHVHRMEPHHRRGPAAMIKSNSTVGQHQHHYMWKAHHINTKMTRF